MLRIAHRSQFPAYSYTQNTQNMQNFKQIESLKHSINYRAIQRESKKLIQLVKKPFGHQVKVLSAL
jgi:hypothetical protein